MYKIFLPNEFASSVFDITPEHLKSLGIKGVITDLDNTLVEWNRKDSTEELTEWINTLRNEGIQIIIASNNNQERVKRFAEPLGIPYIYRAKKPLGKGFREALMQLRLKRNEVAMIGDQMLTDMLGANRQKLYTILVRPVAQSDGFVTKANRFLEKRIFQILKWKKIETWK